MEKNKLRLLVVEDEKKLCDMIAKSLHQAGYEVDTCNDGEQALDNILQSISYLIGEERKILSIASQAGDEVTVSMMSDYLKEQEKLVWMLTAYNSK